MFRSRPGRGQRGAGPALDAVPVPRPGRQGRDGDRDPVQERLAGGVARRIGSLTSWERTALNVLGLLLTVAAIRWLWPASPASLANS